MLFLIRTDGRRNALALRRLEFCTAADTALYQELNPETRIQRLAGTKESPSLRPKKSIKFLKRHKCCQNAC